MKSGDVSHRYQRTLDAKPNDFSIVKPGELVDIIEMSPLTLNDRRIYNQLIANAWDKIEDPVQHIIAKSELKRSLHKGTDRLEVSIRRLMAAIVEIRVRDGKDWVTKRVQLLGSNVIPDATDGFIRYYFQPLMREIIGESRIFARLHREIMFALSSKYALALYEMIQKRGNLSRTSEDLTIEEFRNFLGVPAGKLNSWINFKNFAIKPAVEEVSDLSDFLVTIDPIKGRGKQFCGVRLSWKRKAHVDLEGVRRELSFSKVGRRARRTGTVEAPQLDFGNLHRSQVVLRRDTFDKVKKLCPGYDVYGLENEWRSWAQTKKAPDNADAAFIAFCKLYMYKNPLN